MMTNDEHSSSSSTSSSRTVSSLLDFFHSNNSKILSNTLSNLSAAIVPASSSTASSSISPRCSLSLLNEASTYLGSIKKSFFQTVGDKKRGELKKLMEDVLIEQQKAQMPDMLVRPSTSSAASSQMNKTSIRIGSPVTTPASVDLIEQTKNQTLKALISGPYSTRKIPLPAAPLVADTEAQQSKRMRSNSSSSSSSLKQLAQPPPKQLMSVGERRLNELKTEIIDLVRTNTATSFPVEENTSSMAANKKLVEELNEKEANMTKSMNKGMTYLESSLTKAYAKKEIISNFLKLKSLLNAANTSGSSGGGNDSNGNSDSNLPHVKKLSMRSSTSAAGSFGASTGGGSQIQLDSEQMTRLSAVNVDNSVKRLNLYSSIKSKIIPKMPKLVDEIIEADGLDGEGDDSDADDEEEDDDDGEMEDDEDENETESSESEESITIRKRLTEPHVYVRGKGRGKFECSKCGWRARKQCVLKRHIMVAHANFKPFLCLYCNCAFKTKGNLVRHTKTKAHVKACSKLGMSPSDEEVTRITSKNIDNSQLSKQLEIDKKIKLS